MGVLLEIREGAFAGKKVSVVTGQTVTFGRAAGRAEFALPHDTFMSGVHFAVECGPTGCRVQDRKSSNGTFLNGARVQDAMLANGDEIKGGQTVFTVRVVPDAKLASLAPPLEEAAPPPAAPARSPAPESALPPAAPQRPSAAEPAQPAAPEKQPRTPEPNPPAVPAPPSMRAADPASEDAASRSTPNPAAELASADSLSAPERPAQALPPEPPKFHAIPTPPVEREKPPRVGVSPPNTGESPLGAGAKPQVPEPPPGVAPFMAEKFAERAGTPGAGWARSAAFSVMGWSFPAAPAEWQVQEGFGLQQSGHEEFPSSVAATEELLGGITLQQFVESQISMLRGYLRDPKIEPTMPPRVGGADESMAMDVRHSTKDGRELIYRRIYARSGSSVGVLTVTTLASEFPQVLQSLQPLLDGAAFRSTGNG